jgi:large-conductance mechanosensitive channel
MDALREFLTRDSALALAIGGLVLGFLFGAIVFRTNYCAMGSLSMTAYTVGWQGNVSGAAAGVQVLPPIPPDESNM